MRIRLQRSIQALALGLIAGPLLAQGTLADAFAAGKASVEFRTRYEHDDDAAFVPPATHKTANALTNRTLLGYVTGPFHDLRASLEFLGVNVIGTQRYNDGLNNLTRYATVTDPPQTLFNQAFLSFKGLKLGRQSVSVDNQRFIGPGAWSQTPKTFNGAVFQNDTWLPWTDLLLGHLTQFHSSTGIDQKIRGDFARFRLSPTDTFHVTPFWYGFDQVTTPATSVQHRGLRLDGKVLDWVIYEASYAQQRAYAASTTTLDRQYRCAMVGLAHGALTLKVVDEELEGGFATPYSALHSYYGDSDRIAATPANGLNDHYLLAEYRLQATTFEMQFHRFSAHEGGQPYGREWNLKGWRSFGKHLTVFLEWAGYAADPTAPVAQNLNRDLKKVWLMTNLRF
jgi:hypothetical protein